MAEHVYKASFVLPMDLWDWAADHPEGASDFIRNLLKEARERERQGIPSVPVAATP